MPEGKRIEGSIIEQPPRSAWERYQQVEAGELLPWSLSTKDYFAVAAEFAVQGDWRTKNWLYEHIILAHPDRTSADEARVKINQLDGLRRGGQPGAAEKALRELNLPQDSVTKVEWGQALGQCQFMEKNLDSALTTQREVLTNIDSDPENFPASKRLYYEETILVLKIGAKKVDEEFQSNLERYKKSLQDQDVSPATRDRAVGHLNAVEGRAFIISEHYDQAAECFAAWFDVSPAKRDKAVAAMECLDALYRGNVRHPRQPELEEFFKRNFLELQPTDIVALQEQYDHVTSNLQIHKS